MGIAYILAQPEKRTGKLFVLWHDINIIYNVFRGKYRVVDVHQHLVCTGNTGAFVKQHIPIAILVLLPFDFIAIGLLPIDTQIGRVLKFQIFVYVLFTVQHTGLCAIVDAHIIVMHNTV